MGYRASGLSGEWTMVRGLIQPVSLTDRCITKCNPCKHEKRHYGSSTYVGLTAKAVVPQCLDTVGWMTKHIRVLHVHISETMQDKRSPLGTYMLYRLSPVLTT